LVILQMTHLTLWFLCRLDWWQLMLWEIRLGSPVRTDLASMRYENYTRDGAAIIVVGNPAGAGAGYVQPGSTLHVKKSV
jgi:hypothetical protein